MTTKWTNENIELFKSLYPVSLNTVMANIFDVSLRSVVYYARKFGLTKKANAVKCKRDEYIRTHFHTKTAVQLASELGISRMTVNRIAKRWGLIRTREEKRLFISKVRKDLVLRERRRVIFGLRPISRIKVVSNQRKISMRYRLKSKGYIPGANPNIMYFHEGINRNASQEHNARLMGLRFFPLSESTESNQY